MHVAIATTGSVLVVVVVSGGLVLEISMHKQPQEDGHCSPSVTRLRVSKLTQISSAWQSQRTMQLAIGTTGSVSVLVVVMLVEERVVVSVAT